MEIAIGADHGGYELKKIFFDYLKNKNIDIIDRGTFSTERVDYPDYAKLVADLVSKGKVEKGILICGSGVGMCIAANKFKGVRAALCNDLYTAECSRSHNDANILCIGARIVKEDLALQILDKWLNTEFEGGRHQKRVSKIE